MKRTYAITGVGLVSPIGVGFDQLHAALSQGAPDDAIFRTQMSAISQEKLPGALAAEAWGFDAADHLGKKGLRSLDRLTRMLLVSSKQALEQAGLRAAGPRVSADAADASGGEQGAAADAVPIPPHRIGVVSATAYGSLDVITEMAQVAELEDPRFLNPSRFPNTVVNAAAGYVSIWHDLRAPNVTVVDGNCGALDAFLSSTMHLDNERADAFIVGGGEVLSEPLYLAFRKLEVLAEAGQRFAPGSPDSEGTRIGEGSAHVCLEPAARARARGARVLAEVVGYGNAFEPPESEAVIVHASPIAVERAVTMAVRDAGLAPGDVDLVCSSLSGVPRFDGAELAGIEAALGEVAVVAPKAWYGECFGAGGALALACGLSFLAGAPVAPLVSGRAPAALRHLLVLAVGYYGNVTALVVRGPG